MLNTVVLSDLHFGEPYNLIHDQGVPPVLNLIKIHGGGRLRRLVLAGDIFEMSTPESMEEVRRQARFFFDQARSRIQIDEIVWIPGNHDYSLFRRHVPHLAATDWRGDLAPRELVEEFFGPYAGAVRIAYPHLQLFSRRTGASWIIHHGHLVDDLVLGRRLGDRVSAGFAALTAGHLLTPVAVDFGRAGSLADVERIVRPVLEGIWSHHDDPNNFQNEVWDLVRRWTDYAGCARAEPVLAVTDEHEAGFLDSALDNVHHYVAATRRDDAYRGRDLPGERITLVWGHTHGGGLWRGPSDGIPLRQINLGGWVPEAKATRRGDQAHTHLHLINDDLEERVMAIPFPAGWVERCLDHGKSVFAIPGVDDEFVDQVRSAPPAAGLSVDEILAWQRQRPFGATRSNEDPFA